MSVLCQTCLTLSCPCTFLLTTLFCLYRVVPSFYALLFLLLIFCFLVSVGSAPAPCPVSPVPPVVSSDLPKKCGSDQKFIVSLILCGNTSVVETLSTNWCFLPSCISKSSFCASISIPFDPLSCNSLRVRFALSAFKWSESGCFYKGLKKARERSPEKSGEESDNKWLRRRFLWLLCVLALVLLLLNKMAESTSKVWKK